MKEQETHFCGDPSECHYDEGYEKALKECKKMFEDYNEKLKEMTYDKLLTKDNILRIELNKEIVKLSKEVVGE